MTITPQNSIRSVMIVDDSEVARCLLRDILEACGYSVVAEAANGIEAVEKYVELRPLVTIMDIKMPRKNGIDATKEIIALDRNAKVLICSSTDHEGLMLASAEAGASGIIVKPFVQDQIVEAIESVLQCDVEK